MMIQDLEQFRFFESGNRLPGLVVIHQNNLEARRIKQVALARNARVKSAFVQDPILVDFVAQDAVEKITDMPVGRKLGHVRIRGFFAGYSHHFSDGCISGLRSKNLGEILKKTKAIDDAIRFAILLYHRSHPARTAGESPCHAQLRFRADAIESLHHGLKPRRSICEKDRRFESELFQHPGRLGVKRASASSRCIYPVTFTQKPGISHRGSNRVSVRVDVSDHVRFCLHKMFFCHCEGFNI